MLVGMTSGYLPQTAGSGDLVARQGGRIIARRRLAWPVSPGRVFRVPWDLVSQADPDAGDVVIGLSP